ncbi:MAG: phytoene desaturase [Chloroflexi bacterium]|nr:phytoene desaturase [Chloroflexota bacterium]
MAAKKMVVIGGGFGGLAAAIRLRQQGHDVMLLEKRDQLGGRGYQYHLNGFKFDGGPTVITAPYMFDELFAGSGRKREDYFQLVPVDPFYRIFDEHGRHFDYGGSPQAMLDEVRRWSPGDVTGYQRLMQRVEKIFDRFYQYTDKPFLHLPDMLKIMPAMIGMGTMLSMYPLTALHIKDPFLRKIFSFHPLLIGGSPFSTPSIFALIMHVEKKWGVHYGMGGTGAIVEGLGRLYSEIGGHLCLNTEVQEIMIRGGRAVGVRLANGDEIPADAVICNGDVTHAYQHLIPAAAQKPLTRWRLQKLTHSFSLFVIYFGTQRRYLDSQLAHHNVILTRRYSGLLRDIHHGKHLPDDFALYLHMPTRTDSSIAPEGCESFYVLSVVPNLGAPIPWQEVGQRYRDRIMQFLEDNYLPDLQANIIAEHRIDPLHFQKTLNSYQGAAFGVQPSLLQSAWMRPHNRSDEFPNLYFVGAATHPGAGVPSVLSSGKIAAELIAQEG